MIDVERLCRGCMRQMEQWQRICPMCGFDQEQELNRSPKCLPEETILNGRYLLGRVLGEGGFGITYLALDLVLETPVAIKEYFPMGLAFRDMEHSAVEQVQIFEGERGMYYRRGLENFAQEGRNLAQFRNLPGIVAARDFFFANATAYLVMDYVEGQSLKQYMRQYQQNSPHHTPMDYQTALRLLEPVMKSLIQIHKAGLIHRDISPDNILADAEGNVTLIDFGAARAALENEARSMTVMVKHGYAPEEQYRTHGKQGPWTDVYALCATLYHMISGLMPMDAVERLCEDKLKPLKELPLPVQVPEAVSAVIEKGMALRGKDRYLSMEALYGELKQAQETEAHRETVQTQREAEEARWKRDEKRQQELEASRREAAEEKEKQERKEQQELERIEREQQKQTEERERQEQEQKEEGERILRAAKEKIRRKKVIRKRALTVGLLAGAAFALFVLGMYTKEQKYLADTSALLTDYLSLDSYVEGDSQYILSAEEVSRIKIRRTSGSADLYRVLPAAGEQPDAEQVRAFVEETAGNWKLEKQQEEEAALISGQMAPIFSGTRLAYRWLYPSGESMELSQQKLSMETIQDIYQDYFFDAVSSTGMISTSFSVPNEGGSSVREDGTWLIHYAGDGLLAVSDGEKAGYVTEEGETVIPFQFETAGAFSDGLAQVSFERTVEENDVSYGYCEKGYINEQGELAIPSVFFDTTPFCSGLAAVSFYSREGELYWGYVDTEGSLRMVFRPEAFGTMYYEAFYQGGTLLGPCSPDGTVAVGWRQMGNLAEMENQEQRTAYFRQQKELWDRDAEANENMWESCQERYGDKYVQGGWYLFDQNGKLVTAFDHNYDVSAFLPCGLALVHDMHEVNELWLEGSSDYEDFCEKMAAGKESRIRAWYINTKGEQVGEQMNFDISGLAQIETQLFGWLAKGYHYSWMKDDVFKMEEDGENAASKEEKEEIEETETEVLETLNPDQDAASEGTDNDTYLGTIMIEMQKGNVAMAINPNGQLTDLTHVASEEELYKNPKAFLTLVLMEAMSAETGDWEEEDLQNIINKLDELGYVDQDGDGYRETPEGADIALNLIWFTWDSETLNELMDQKNISKILTSRFAIKEISFKLSDPEGGWQDMIGDWSTPGKTETVDAVFLPMPKNAEDYNEMRTQLESDGISVLAFPSY